MNEHTPGPWRVEHDKSGVYVMTPGQGIAKLYDVTPAEWVKDQQVSVDANARLIAAAPTLLSTLQWITQEMKRVGEIDVIEATRHLLKLQAAIASASPQESEADK